jgi:phosphonate transport system substrate-binding protein
MTTNSDRPRRHLAALAFAAFLSVGIAAGGPAMAQPTLSFSAIPNQDETHLLERFNKVAAYLQKELGVPVKYVPVKSYPAAVTAFKNNHIQLAWFGGLTGVQARLAVPGSVAIAQGVEDTAFVTYFIAHSSTGLSAKPTLGDDVKGKTFTFGSKGSTSGRLMPEFYLREIFKADPEKVFSRVGFSGDHTKTLDLVSSGAYQIGALDFTVYEAALKAGKVDTKAVTVIWKTPPYPDYNWSIRGDVDKTFGPGFIKKVQDALVKMNDPELLATFPRSKFIPAANKDYQPVEDTARLLNLIDG